MHSVEPDDAELIAADPDLPGLRDVLEPARLMERVGWDFYTVEVRYLRYKPGESIVAGLAVTDKGGKLSLVQAFAYATPSHHPSLDQPSLDQPFLNHHSLNHHSLGLPSLDQPFLNHHSLDQPSLDQPSLDQHSLSQHRSLSLSKGRPTDTPPPLEPVERTPGEHNPGDTPSSAQDKLAKLRIADSKDDVGRGVLIDADLAAGIADATADRELPGIRRFLREHPDAQPLVYKPGRRWVGRVERDGRSRLVKIYRPGTLEDLKLKHRAVEGLPVPEILHYSKRGIVTSAWVPGTPLNETPAAQRTPAWRRAGALLARLHAQPIPDALPLVASDDHLTAAVHGLAAIAPHRVDQAMQVAHAVRAGLRTNQPRLAHGDFSADQVVVGPDGELTLLDLDRLGQDDPHADLASWFGAALAAGGVETISELDPLLDGYEAAGGHVDPAKLRLNCARAVLQRAAEPFRRHVEQWPEEVDRLMRVAQELATC